MIQRNRGKFGKLPQKAEEGVPEEDGGWQMVLTSENVSAPHGRTSVMGREAVTKDTMKDAYAGKT